MKLQLWDEELTEEETEQLLSKMCDEITRRKLDVPAILLFEMHKPVANFMGQSAIVFSPFLVPFVGFDNVNNYTRLLSKRENVERLLVKIEEHKHQLAEGATK